MHLFDYSVLLDTDAFFCKMSPEKEFSEDMSTLSFIIWPAVMCASESESWLER